MKTIGFRKHCFPRAQIYNTTICVAHLAEFIDLKFAEVAPRFLRTTMGRACKSSASTRTITGARQTGFFETSSTMPAATHGAAIMLAAAHERRQAPPYGLSIPIKQYTTTIFHCKP